MKITSKILSDKLDSIFPEAQCELNYSKDYELLIATVLSAQSTDRRVNQVTKELFSKYDIHSLANAKIDDVENIIKSVGTFKRKAVYIKKIASSLVDNYNGVVPNNRTYLESLPGVGRKTCNVVLSNIYNVPAIAVDTHVSRVSKRLGLAKTTDSVEIIERKLMKQIPKKRWSKMHHQLVLFGRYICKAKNPECDTCILRDYCHEKRTK